ncbi:MAG: TonB-dependent receptor [Burkholderiales bacterium]|nr:TonB-dependent receptor [Burkholderiales bacterium]
MVEKMLSRSVRLMFVGGVAMSASLLAQQAVAQEAVQRVEITGSAIKRIDAETAVPVTVLKADDLKKQGLTSIEQIMSSLASVQSQQGTSQVVGLGTGGASFANLRGIGANKTLVLLNGRRLANNAFDSSAPDLNMIPFAALERVEVLRDGASALYGSDAVGGVINFITRKDFKGGTVTIGADKPQHPGGKTQSANFGFGFGDMAKDGYNIFAVVDFQKQDRIGGTDRPFNTRYAGGISPTTSAANFYQDDKTGNPTAPSCAAGTNLVPDGSGTGCLMTTSSFVDYVPKSERTTGLIKGTFKLTENHELGFEYLASQSKVNSQIAPVPYGGLFMNRVTPSGALNPFYPGNPGAVTSNIPLSNTYTEAGTKANILPGFIHVKWRDLPNGPRADENINNQQRAIVSLTGTLGAWDYETAVSYNENRVTENLSGYSNGNIIKAGVLDGVINPFGPQSAAGTALIESAALNGNIQNAKGTTTGIDAHASREVGDWFHAGRAVGLAIGGEAAKQEFVSAANPEYAAKVVSSTGIDPDTRNEGSRNVYALYAELNVPVLKDLDVTAALRYDNFSDFGHTTNPKVGFRYQPTKSVLVRGSYSTGFRAPSLYEINSAQTYGNTTKRNDPINCPGGTAIPGKPTAANCQQQFQSLSGGNKNLDPETSKNMTLGLVIEPLANLTLGLDFWSISLKHTIGTLNQDDVFGNAAKYAALYHRNPLGNLATDGSQCPDPATCGYVDLRNQNLGGVNTNGFDMSAAYKLRTSDLGSFGFSLNSTYINKYEYQNSEGGEWLQNVGIYSGTGPIFQWQHNGAVNWTSGQFGVGFSGHYKTGYTDSPTEDNPLHHVASYTTFDGYGSWTIGKGFSVTAGVRNMFDRTPPLTYQTQTFQAGYDPRYTDPTGRTYYLRGTYSF